MHSLGKSVKVTTSVEIPEKRYEIAIGRGHHPVDALLAACTSKEFIDSKKETLLRSSIIEKCVGKTVLLAGNCYDSRSVSKLVEVAQRVGYYAISEKDPYSSKGLTRESVSNDSSMEFLGWPLSVIRNFSGKALNKEDEFLYQSIRLTCFEYGKDYHYVFSAMLKTPCSSLDKRIKAHVQEGGVVVSTTDMNAVDLAENYGVEIDCCGYRARVVQGPAIPVYPYTRAAAQGFDVGINVRRDYRTNKTHVSFFTDDPKNVSLDFVEKLFKGEGESDRHCKSRTFEGMRQFPTKSVTELQKHLTEVPTKVIQYVLEDKVIKLIKNAVGNPVEEEKDG